MKLDKLFKFGVILTAFCFVPTLSNAQNVSNIDKVLNAMKLLNFSYCTDEIDDEKIKKLCKTYLEIYNVGKAHGLSESLVWPTRDSVEFTRSGTEHTGDWYANWLQSVGSETEHTGDGYANWVPSLGSETKHTGDVITNWVPSEGSKIGNVQLYRQQKLLVLDDLSPEALKIIKEMAIKNSEAIEK